MRGRATRLTGGLAAFVAAASVVLAGCTSTPAQRPVTPVIKVVPPSATVRPDTGGPHRGERPNLLLISSDDQNGDELRFMPRTRRLLAAHGVTFRQALSPHPLCCPARAEILTGQYAQNNGVRHNHGPRGGVRPLDAKQTLATWLHAAGYRTGFVGKYLNGYGPWSRRPPGWSVWNPMLEHVYDYYGTTFVHQQPGDARRYSVDVVADRTVDYIDRFSRGDRPFFLWASQVAPHATPRQLTAAGPHRGISGLDWGPPRVAPRFASLPVGPAPSLAKPSFNRLATGDRTCVCERGEWGRGYVQDYYAERVRAVQAVDEGVARAVRALARNHELANTYVVFLSDNGYLLGEHGAIGKNMAYDEDMVVPFVVRGPDVRRPGRDTDVPITLADLAPTFLDIAGATSSRILDGTSFWPVLRGERQRWRDTQLIQAGTDLPGYPQAWGYRGVRTDRFTYTRDPVTGEERLFDRRRDPYELRDVSRRPAYADVRAELERRTALLSTCNGEDCVRRFGPLPGRGGR